MQKQILILLFILPTITKQSYSQSWAQLGAHWHYNYSLMGCCSGYYEIMYKNDSLVGGKTCSVLQKTVHSYNSITQMTSISNNGYEYMYTNNNKTFRYINGNFYLAYDFGLQPADSMQFYWDGGAYQCDTIGLMRIDSVGTTTINSVTIKFQKVSIFNDYTLTWEYYPYRILERIGSLGSMFFYRYSCNLIVDGPVYEPLRCYYDSAFGQYDNGVSTSCTYIYNGIADIDFSNSILLSPNPTTTSLQLSLANWQSEKMQIEIFDVLSKSILRSEIYKAQEITVSDLPSGVYYLKISGEGKSAVKKFVKM